MDFSDNAPEFLERGAVYCAESLVPYNVYSQWGEDGLVKTCVDAIGGPSNKYVIDFGAGDGLMFSNSRHLLESGWVGCLMEADKERFELLQTNSQGFNGTTLLNCYVDVYGEKSLDNLLTLAEAPKEPDVMSCDIDGQDCWVWNSLLKFWPRVVLIEVDPILKKPFPFVNGSGQCGIDYMMKIAASKGYNLCALNFNNALFIRRDLEDLVFKGNKKLERVI